MKVLEKWLFHWSNVVQVRKLGYFAILKGIAIQKKNLMHMNYLDEGIA